MGANPTQAQALVLFLVAFICIAGSFAANLNWMLMIIGLVVMAAAIALFLKAKPWEQKEG
jgi:1,4-dihydroxy-2-naphthoate octaprenyltransferase